MFLRQNYDDSAGHHATKHAANVSQYGPGVADCQEIARTASAPFVSGLRFPSFSASVTSHAAGSLGQGDSNTTDGHQ